MTIERMYKSENKKVRGLWAREEEQNRERDVVMYPDFYPNLLPINFTLE